MLQQAPYDKSKHVSGLKETEYLILLGEDCRIRHYHGRIAQQVVEFIVQLEIEIDSVWKPVVRYDTSHGFAHRDIIHFNEVVEKTPLAIGDYNTALTFAELDIHSNWGIYRERFLKEAKKK